MIRCRYCHWPVSAHTAGELARCNHEQRTLVAEFGEARCGEPVQVEVPSWEDLEAEHPNMFRGDVV